MEKIEIAILLENDGNSFNWDAYNKNQKGVACVLRGFEGRGCKSFSGVLAPGPAPLFSFNGPPETVSVQFSFHFSSIIPKYNLNLHYN